LQSIYILQNIYLRLSMDNLSPECSHNMASQNTTAMDIVHSRKARTSFQLLLPVALNLAPAITGVLPW